MTRFGTAVSVQKTGLPYIPACTLSEPVIRNGRYERFNYGTGHWETVKFDDDYSDLTNPDNAAIAFELSELERRAGFVAKMNRGKSGKKFERAVVAFFAPLVEVLDIYFYIQGWEKKIAMIEQRDEYERKAKLDAAYQERERKRRESLHNTNFKVTYHKPHSHRS